MTAARVFAGRPEQAGEARRWLRTVAAAACGEAAGDVELAVAELFANAVLHSRSGQAGGLVTVVVVAGPGGAEVHVHDQGADGGQVPHVVLGAVPAVREGGQGLRIVASVAAGWGAGPAAWCPRAAAGDPAVAAGGCCVWCRIAPQSAPAEGGGWPVPSPRPGRELEPGGLSVAR